eukprot:15341651-Ditylum_brightwellii.AAC.1
MQITAGEAADAVVGESLCSRKYWADNNNYNKSASAPRFLLKPGTRSFWSSLPTRTRKRRHKLFEPGLPKPPNALE